MASDGGHGRKRSIARGRARAGKLLLLGVVAVAVAWPATARGHGGQRLVPMRAVLESAGSFRIEFSLDVALTSAAEGIDPMAVTHEWIGGRSEEELAAIVEASEAYLRECFTFHFADGLIDGAFAFPDLDRLPDPAFTSDEPSGHLLVLFEGVLPGAGETPGRLTLTLSAEAPAAVVTVVVDGRPKRRPIVAIAGETRIIETIEPAAPVVAAVPESAVGAGEDDPVEGGAIPEGDGFVFADDEPAPVGAFGPLFGLGWSHVWPRGILHVALALAVFLVAPRWPPVIAGLAALSGGAVAGALVPGSVGVLEAWGHVAGIVGVAVLTLVIAWSARDSARAGASSEGDDGASASGRPRGAFGGLAAAAGAARLLVLGAIGWLHASGMTLLVGSAHLPVTARLAEVAGVEAAHWAVVALAFVLLGWAWDAPWYRRRVTMAGSIVVALASLLIVAMRTG